MSILEIKELGKTYGTGERAVHAVGRVSHGFLAHGALNRIEKIAVAALAHLFSFRAVSLPPFVNAASPGRLRYLTRVMTGCPCCTCQRTASVDQLR